MASKKKKGSAKSASNSKRITVDDLKSKNIVLKKKSRSTVSKSGSNNKVKTVKSVNEIKKNTPKNVIKEAKNVENISVKKKEPNIKNKSLKKNNNVFSKNSNIDEVKDTDYKLTNSNNEISSDKKMSKKITDSFNDGKFLSTDTKDNSIDTFSNKSVLVDENISKNKKLGKERKRLEKLKLNVNFDKFIDVIKQFNFKLIFNKNSESKSIISKKKVLKNKVSKKDKLKVKKKKNNVNKKKPASKNKTNKNKTGIYKSNKDIEIQLRNTKIKKCLSIIAFVCVTILVIEFGVFAYMKVFKPGDNSYDALNSIIFDDTSLVSVGSSYFKHSSNFEETNRIEKGRLVRFDKRGKLELEVQYDRGINSTFTSVALADGGYYVVGSSEFSKEQESNQIRDAILVKYSLEGKKLWEKSYSVLSDTRFNKIIVVEDGLIVVGQSIYQNMEMGNHNTGGGIIVKYDFSGEIVWSNNHGGNKSGNFNDVISLNNEYYVVGKDSKDTGILVKFNSTGKYIFHKNYSYTDYLGFSSITTDGKNLYVAGSKKVLDKVENELKEGNRNTKNTDALIVKYNLDGEKLSEKTFGGSSYERYNAIQYFGGSLYVVGSTSSNDSGLRVSSENGEITAMLIKCDTNLQITRKDIFGGSNDDNMLDLITDGSNVYMVGYSNSNDSNIKTSHDNGSDFISKLIKVDYRFRILMKK